jgi:type IV pilus assembly protein PilY1
VVAVGSVRTTRRAGRLSWREIVNWRELHEVAK